MTIGIFILKLVLDLMSNAWHCLVKRYSWLVLQYKGTGLENSREKGLDLVGACGTEPLEALSNASEELEDRLGIVDMIVGLIGRGGKADGRQKWKSCRVVKKRKEEMRMKHGGIV